MNDNVDQMKVQVDQVKVISAIIDKGANSVMRAATLVSAANAAGIAGEAAFIKQFEQQLTPGRGSISFWLFIGGLFFGGLLLSSIAVANQRAQADLSSLVVGPHNDEQLRTLTKVSSPAHYFMTFLLAWSGLCFALGIINLATAVL
jgi:hypothetical protein